MIIIPLASLLNDRERRVKQFCKCSRALCKAKVGHHRKVLGTILSDVVGEHVYCRELIYWDVEESLQLPLMEVHGEDAIRAGNLQHVRNESCGNWDAWLIFLV